MHIMLFEGLNVRKGQSLALLCRTFWNYCHVTAIAIKQEEIFCRHYESKPGFLHGQVESKMAQNRGISGAHTCTTYYRKCLPLCAQPPPPSPFPTPAHGYKPSVVIQYIHSIFTLNILSLNVTD